MDISKIIAQASRALAELRAREYGWPEIQGVDALEIAISRAVRAASPEAALDALASEGAWMLSTPPAPVRARLEAKRAEARERRRQAEEAARLKAEEAARRQAEEAARRFEAALDVTQRRFGDLRDARGARVAHLQTLQYSEGHTSSLGGWSDGGTTVIDDFYAAEDGRRVEPREWLVNAADSREWLFQCGRPYPAGREGVPPTSAASEWLPPGAARPAFARWDCTGPYSSEYEAEAAWAEAWADKERAAEAKQAEAERIANSPFAALAALKAGK